MVFTKQNLTIKNQQPKDFLNQLQERLVEIERSTLPGYKDFITGSVDTDNLTFQLNPLIKGRTRIFPIRTVGTVNSSISTDTEISIKHESSPRNVLIGLAFISLTIYTIRTWDLIMIIAILMVFLLLSSFNIFGERKRMNQETKEHMKFLLEIKGDNKR